MNRYRIFAVAALIIVGLAGCQRQTAPVDMVGAVSIREAVTIADPQTAVDRIYETLPESRTEPLDAATFADLFPDLGEVVEEYYGAISDPNGGLADVVIVKPRSASDNRETVREALRAYQEKRIREFENYDILNALTIATDAQVVDQGDYVLLLMLPDNEAAQEIIDQYLPL